MIKSRLLGAICAYTLIVLAQPSQAAVINSISGLDIGGTMYDVTFHNGKSFNNLWDADNDGLYGGAGSAFSTAPTFWGNDVGAETAAHAIIAHLGTGDTTNIFNSDSFIIPVSRHDGALVITAGLDHILSYHDNDTRPMTELVLTRIDQENSVPQLMPYASFTAIVPLPPALYLLGTGLIGLIGVARRKA